MVYTVSYEAPPVKKSEILRYAGVKGNHAETTALIDECLEEMGELTYRVCYGKFNVSELLTIESKTLAHALDGCDGAIVFAATVGLQIDRLIARYTPVSPAKALIFQAIGAERIESLCDLFCSDMSALTPRVSPGYGDLTLEVQKDIFALLDCPRKIGLTLNKSCLMSPSKSVTAIFGVRSV